MNFRSPKLLDLAKEVPFCVYCKAPNEGQVVACHANSIRFGKGMGVKAHDIPAYLCKDCHDIVDGRVKLTTFDRKDRELRLLEGVYLSILWLLQEGHLEVK